MDAWFLNKMVDTGMAYEIFANGHPRFLTSACKKKVMESNIHMAESFSCFEEGYSLDQASGSGSTKDVHITGQELADVTQRGTRHALRARKGVSEQSVGGRLIRAGKRLPEPEEEFGCRCV